MLDHWPESAREATKDSDAPYQGSEQDWEQFVRDNAVAIVKSKNASIKNLRKELSRVTNHDRCLAKENKKLIALLKECLEAVGVCHDYYRQAALTATYGPDQEKYRDGYKSMADLKMRMDKELNDHWRKD